MPSLEITSIRRYNIPMAMTGCRHFNGYKPCGKSTDCSCKCTHYDEPLISILIVHLGALGAVLRATSILPAIKRKYPSSRVTWVTDNPAQHLLANNPYLDRVLTTHENDLLVLSALEFDVAFCVDKSLKAAGVLKRTHADLLFGFRVDPQTAAILPATAAAEELWSLGLDNHKKFFVNKKSEVQLMIEAFELGQYQGDDYVLQLTKSEQDRVLELRKNWQADRKTIIGINTGSSPVIQAKKLTVEFQRQIVAELAKNADYQIVLLGGPEDTIRNQRIAYGLPVIQTPTERGIRDGLVSAAAVDVMITSDSLGMHMGIALKKWIVAWFGPTCAHEIEFYNRGSAILTKATCAPCWKRTCSEKLMCYDQVSLPEIMQAVEKGALWIQQKDQTSNTKTLSCKPLLSETSSLVSP